MLLLFLLFELDDVHEVPVLSIVLDTFATPALTENSSALQQAHLADMVSTREQSVRVPRCTHHLFAKLAHEIRQGFGFNFMIASRSLVVLFQFIENLIHVIIPSLCFLGGIGGRVAKSHFPTFPFLVVPAKFLLFGYLFIHCLFPMAYYKLKTLPIIKTVSTMIEENKDIIFIRHAESELNEASHNYRVKHNLPYIWELLSK